MKFTVRIIGWTALHLAATADRLEVDRILIDAGANMKILDNEGRAAHELAATDAFRDLFDSHKKGARVP